MRLLTLGGLDLRGVSGASLPAVLSQKKRVALLCYLAAREPGGYVQRHAAAAMFWPDSEETRARGALRNSLHYLRRVLGADAIMVRGDEEIGVDPRIVRCDVVEFERAIEAGRLEEALALYRGPLLDGFLPANLPEFTDWLDNRRRSLTWQAVDAAKTLVERASEDDARAAVPWARRWIELAPYEEPAIRALMHVLSASGDRASALEAFSGWAAQLQRELGARPSATTQRMAEGLRAAAKPVPLDADSAAPLDPAAASIPNLATPQRSGTAEPAIAGDAPAPALQRLAALRGKSRWFGVGAGAVLAAGAAAYFTLAAPRAALTEAPVVAVLPFSYGGGEAYRYLGPGMVELLATHLAATSSVRAVDARAVLAIAGGTAAIDERRGRALARHFDATHFVLGGILEINGELQLAAGLYEAGGRERRVSDVTLKGDAAHLFHLVGRVGAGLLQQALGEGGASPVLGTNSPAATEAYLEGETAYISGQYRQAADAFERAVQADSAFARANLSLSFATNWLGLTEVQWAATASASRHESRLSDDDRLLLRAWHAHTGPQPDPPRADSLYSALLRDRPDHVTAWYQLAELRFHWGPTFGVPTEEATPAFERTLELVQSHAGALMHLMRLRARAGRSDEIAELGRRVEAVGVQSTERLEARALVALAANDEAAFDRITIEIWRQGNPQAVLPRLFVNSYNPRLVLRAARSLLETNDDAALRRYLRLLIAQIETARGAWGAAAEEAGAIASISAPRAAETTAMIHALPFVPATDELSGSADAVRRRVGSWAGGQGANILQDAIFGPRAVLLEGLLRLRLGDSLAVEGVLQRLDRFTGVNPPLPRFGRDYALLLRARRALEQGNAEAAVEALGDPRIEADGVFTSVLSFPKSLERWTRAEALEQQGRDREALRWFATFPDPTASDIPFLAMAHYRRAVIYDRLGELPESLAHYEAFVRLASPNALEIASELRTAHERLQQLRGS